MNRDQWQRATEFSQAAVKPLLDEGEVFLLEARGEDRELRRAVELRLEANEEVGAFMDRLKTRHGS